MTGGVGGNGGDGGSGVLLSAGGTVANNGQITGGNGNRGGGAGVVSGSGSGGAAGTGGSGIAIDSDGAVTNNASGRITGGNGGDNGAGGGGPGGNGGGGLVLTGHGQVDNSGQITGGNGGSGANGAGGAGGSGGTGGAGTVVVGSGNVTNRATIRGGTGGSGGGGAGSGAGGTGGTGGSGVLLSHGGVLNNNGTIIGGSGTRGGNSSSTGGDGGTGGSGVQVTIDGGTITNTGSITGGQGAVAGAGSSAGAAGAGGVGISGQNIAIINSGSIAGGLSSAGTAATAIQFTGGTNSLELHKNSSITGTVDATVGNNTLILGGSDDDSFNAANIGSTAQYRGFAAYEKDGSSTWTLSGTTAALTPWTINQGTLVVSQDGSLGDPSGSLTLNGGTLRWGASYDLASSRAVTLGTNGGTLDTNGFNSTLEQGITGSGALTKAGAGTLLLQGDNPFAGGTTIAAGTLIVGDPNHAGAALSGGGNVLVASGATLGGYGSVTGNVTNNGTLAVGDALPQFASNGTASTRLATPVMRAVNDGGTGNFIVNGNLLNAGLVQLGGNRVGNTLTVNGNYTGQQGVIALHAELGVDNSPTDRLVINSGSATGNTVLNISNLGGRGGLTLGNGIEVVAANNGATTAASAFSGRDVSAGAYTYRLFQGGKDAGTQENWYLRSTLTNPIEPPPGSIDGETPLYRSEDPVYMEIPALGRQMLSQQIGTFHDRMGGQDLLTEEGKMQAGWGRIWGDHLSENHTGTVNPSFDGNMFGLQVGQDVYDMVSDEGHRDHIGFILGYGHASGDISGFALGEQNLAAGSLSMQTWSVGGYWTHIAPQGWYSDMVVLGSYLHADPGSVEGNTANAHGQSLTTSAETGISLPLSERWQIEPQAQLIYQYIHINDLTDPASTVSFDNTSGLTARVGARLAGSLQGQGQTWHPYVRLDVLHYFGQDDRITFADTTTLNADARATQGHVGAGVYTRWSKTVSGYATAGYWFNLGGEHSSMAEGNVGLRLDW
ncbi:fibronectin-binding autotransporter adhesin [Silvimonas terrae]|uniref:Fibronectin-binding autotransporter adhesin n=1 Tax=Silvimonas terrae TaxID=300266 RepID=A0A840RHB7_9NEIS|nr:autotransporter outer membrane beta-barrel domain-containing protein [Silvimonas terrae]MBB5191716.1 fibronectin-binding autotransporter adhesin [Silvimonas terrae]